MKNKKQMIQDFQAQTTRLVTMTHEMQACLLEEQAALSQLSSEAIAHIANQKNRLVQDIEQQSRVIHQQLQNMGIQSGLPGLFDWLDKLPESSIKQTLVSDWTSIKELTQANRQTNESNGACVALSQRQAQRSIDILRGQFANGSHTYGPDGNTSSGGYSVRHSIA